MGSLDRALLAGLLLWLGTCHSTSAATFSYRGTFAHDDDVQRISFPLASVSDVTIRTYAYGGGIQADGTTIDHGGFDPILDLFDAAGNFIAEADDEGAPGTANADPDTHEAFDAVLNMTLGAGSYTVALVQYDNSANGKTLAEVSCAPAIRRLPARTAAAMESSAIGATTIAPAPGPSTFW